MLGGRDRSRHGTRLGFYNQGQSGAIDERSQRAAPRNGGSAATAGFQMSGQVGPHYPSEAGLIQTDGHHRFGLRHRAGDGCRGWRRPQPRGGGSWGRRQAGCREETDKGAHCSCILRTKIVAKPAAATGATSRPRRYGGLERSANLEERRRALLLSVVAGGARIALAMAETAWPFRGGFKALATDTILLGRRDVVNPDIVGPLLQAESTHVRAGECLCRHDARRGQ
jgi:hypothetical protein